jgi:hypothetical protein
VGYFYPRLNLVTTEQALMCLILSYIGILSIREPSQFLGFLNFIHIDVKEIKVAGFLALNG